LTARIRTHFCSSQGSNEAFFVAIAIASSCEIF
jgi:hypothetical protein